MLDPAISVASQQGLRVVVPRHNRRNGTETETWLLDSAILVQDHNAGGLRVEGGKAACADHRQGRGPPFNHEGHEEHEGIKERIV